MTSADDFTAILGLAEISLFFGRIERTTFHPDGCTPESDSDHTVMLSWIATALAAELYPQLDLGLVAQFALVHDAVEVLAGDESTLRGLTPEQQWKKQERERHAANEFANRFAYTALRWFPWMIRRYEDQQELEARFVRAVDKLVPKLTHLLNDCAAVRKEGMTADELAERLANQQVEIAGYAGEFTELAELQSTFIEAVLRRLRRLEANENATPL